MITQENYKKGLRCRGMCCLCRENKDSCYQYIMEVKGANFNNNSDFDKMLSIFKGTNFEFVTAKGDFQNTLDDNLYIACYASWEKHIIVVHEFNNDGKLMDIYIADGCQTLEEFVISD